MRNKQKLFRSEINDISMEVKYANFHWKRNKQNY